MLPSRGRQSQPPALSAHVASITVTIPRKQPSGALASHVFFKHLTTDCTPAQTSKDVLMVTCAQIYTQKLGIQPFPLQHFLVVCYHSQCCSVVQGQAPLKGSRRIGEVGGAPQKRRKWKKGLGVVSEKLVVVSEKLVVPVPILPFASMCFRTSLPT